MLVTWSMGVLPGNPGAVQGVARNSRAKCNTWATISPVLKCRSKPICPVAQNVQPKAQPACEETHTVARGLLAQRLGQIGHHRKIGSELLVKPVIDLFRPKRRLSTFHEPLL